MPDPQASIAWVSVRHERPVHRGHSRETTEDDLVARARVGDAEAFGEIVVRHRGAVYRAALAALGSEADAEDIAQDALVLAYRRLHQFRGDAGLRTWMVSIAWRLALSRRRRRWWRATRNALPESVLHAMPVVAQSADAGMQSAEIMAGLRREIRRLPRKLREALLLTAAGDLTQDEIAVALKIPGSTFRGRVRDARLRLKERMKPTR